MKLGLGYSLPSSETEENGDKFIIQHWTVTTVTVEVSVRYEIPMSCI